MNIDSKIVVYVIGMIIVLFVIAVLYTWGMALLNRLFGKKRKTGIIDNVVAIGSDVEIHTKKKGLRVSDSVFFGSRVHISTEKDDNGEESEKE